MSLYRDEAIVLRTQKLGEADRIITMLTKDHGRIRGVAKGVRRTMSKFGARLEPGSHVDIMEKHSLRIISVGQLLQRYWKLLSAFHLMSKSLRYKSFN
jgi:DNA repair protein RecO (recombination protein O)